MAAYDGARVEIYDEVWSEPDGPETELNRTVSVWGRAASGAWLTREDAQCPLVEEDIDVLMENDGYLFLSEEGKEQPVEQVSAAFPGADVRYYSEDEDEEAGELDVAGVTPVFELEYSMDLLVDA
ncbi:hypothetical protein SAMN02982929_06632 [Saccharopolyspora kobensis]|uniref:Uncharacterized protein n=1 Tax=Saccharopolyspora kobensis TaxID=146035 RepID=A0A1H6EJA9_9PSEU|nr:hypothetical protein [Saccharopolyspora kobensis]SEG97066.1 hypothetical protein SAMN02982929_06632 [Saccharopolyspora kobensis]SFE66039.1 hypothetical protein SAMN05216506_11388 [Saccharopolyspora kobensis]